MSKSITTPKQGINSNIHMYFITPISHLLTCHGLNGHLKKQNFLPPLSSYHVDNVKLCVIK
jgi:hypothetical protein